MKQSFVKINLNIHLKVPANIIKIQKNNKLHLNYLLKNLNE